MNTQRALTIAAILIASIGFESASLADPAASKNRIEAQARMDRAVALINEENYGAALAEFMAVYALAPQPVVRYNIGLVQAAMGRPVEAVEWLEACLKDPATLTKAELDRAEVKLKEQRARIGTLMVTSNVPGSTIEVDGLDAGKTPLATAIRVSSGIHIVTVVTTGYAPVRREVKVPGLTETPVVFELTPLQGSVARLAIATELPGAEVLIDGAVAGMTPLLGPLKVTPGGHRLELRRAGYASVFRDVTLGDGDAITVKEELKEDADWIAAHGGSLVIRFSETHPIVVVDGLSRGEYQGSLRLAPGVHRLSAQRAGFATVERDVEVTANRETAISIRFEPNPDTLVKFKEDVERRRKWGIGLTVGGAFAAMGGLGGLGYSIEHFNAIDTKTLVRSGEREAYRSGGWISGATAGLGIGALAAGIILLAGNDDPYRYDVKPSGQRLVRVEILPVASPNWSGVIAMGRF